MSLKTSGCNVVSQNLKSSLYSLGCGGAEPWVCLSFLAVTGVDPKPQEMLECLALSDWLLELTSEQSSQSLNTGDLLELGWVGELPGCLSALNQDRRAETEPVAVTAADESTLSAVFVWSLARPRLASCLCHSTLYHCCPLLGYFTDRRKRNPKRPWAHSPRSDHGLEAFCYTKEFCSVP